MILYHGGTDIIREPQIILSETGRDFDAGFYTTNIYEQAASNPTAPPTPSKSNRYNYFAAFPTARYIFIKNNLFRRRLWQY